MIFSGIRIDKPSADSLFEQLGFGSIDTYSSGHQQYIAHHQPVLGCLLQFLERADQQPAAQ